MTLPANGFIKVVAVKSLRGGMKQAEQLLNGLPGSKLGRCEKCFCKVLLAPSTIEQKKVYPGHRLLCYDCAPAIVQEAVTVAALNDLSVLHENDPMKNRQ